VLIQLLLVLAVLALLFVFVRSSNAAYIQASKRIGLVLFALVNIYAVMRPDDLTVVAHVLGVGRGTDLVLYGLVVAFMFGMFSMYQRFRVVDGRFTELARTVAIREAELLNAERRLRSDDVLSVATGDGGRTPIDAGNPPETPRERAR
jgi:hypothetical protein